MDSSKIMDILQKKYPSPKTTLNKMRSKPDAFKILISCLISLRTRDENTKIATEKLFAVVKTPKGILNLPIEKLEELIFSSGHYKKKSQILKHVSSELINRFNSKVPNTKEELLSIKWIGPKTASIVLAFAFNKETIPVDTNVHRIVNRIGWLKTKNPNETQIELEKILPKKYWKEFNSICMQHGREICKPIKPDCKNCPIKNYCKKIIN